MVDLAMLQAVRDVVAIFGVIAGFTYYVLTVRNAQKARQTEMFMQLYRTRYDPENVGQLWTLMSLSWEDYQDYEQKYSPRINPEQGALTTLIWGFYDGLGLLVKNKMVDMTRCIECSARGF